jgi:hypothetical protein
LKKTLSYVVVGVASFLSALGGSSLVSLNQIKGGGTGTYMLQSVNGVNSWGSIPAIPAWQLNITPGGSITGTNPTFTLPVLPQNASSILLFRNGLLQQQSATGDFTVAGVTITFNSASIPQTGDILTVTYF